MNGHLPPIHDAGRLRRPGRIGSRRCELPRPGITILESVTALFVLGVALTFSVQLLSTASRQLRRLEDRDRANWAVSNVLERLTRGGMAAPPAVAAAHGGEWEWPEPPPPLASLPGARIVVEMTAATVDPSTAAGDRNATASRPVSGQRIRVSVVGPGERGTREVLAALTAWKFGGEAPP